jgi:hypothetical protein
MTTPTPEVLQALGDAVAQAISDSSTQIMTTTDIFQWVVMGMLFLGILTVVKWNKAKYSLGLTKIIKEINDHQLKK